MDLLNAIYHEYSSKNKIDIATTFIWYHYRMYNEASNVKIVNEYFDKSYLSKYNSTYLLRDLKKSKDVISAGRVGFFKPSKEFMLKLDSKFTLFLNKTEEVVSSGSIIPEALFINTRGYIISLCTQINACYENNIFDGCAVLMRRLLEILLIHSYEAIGKIANIQDGDEYRSLSYIVNYTVSNRPFSLSKEVLSLFDTFRELGNFSAHKIHYNAKKQYIDEVKNVYRLAVEELLYAANIKK